MFGLRSWICYVFWVNRTRWNRIRQYFCNLRICSLFFEFLKKSKNHKGDYRVTGQAIFDLIALQKKLKKSEKYRKNFRIVKIPSDSVSVSPIYLSHLKNPKSVRCQVRTFLNDTFEKFYALKNLSKFETYRKNYRRAKIFLDSVSAGPIYIFHRFLTALNHSQRA